MPNFSTRPAARRARWFFAGLAVSAVALSGGPRLAEAAPIPPVAPDLEAKLAETSRTPLTSPFVARPPSAWPARLSGAARGAPSSPVGPTMPMTDAYQIHIPLMSNGARESNVFGVDMKPITASPYYTQSGGLDYFVNTRGSWIRRNGVLWSWIEPTPGERMWENDDYYDVELELQRASELGYKTIVIVRRAPEWARQVADQPCGRIADQHLPAFGNFMFDLVTRLSAPPFNVHDWEIWNEPDVDPKYFAPPIQADPPYYDQEFGCYGDETDLQGYGGGHYADLLKAVYPRIKQADPKAQVYVGGLLLACDPVFSDTSYCRITRFMDGVLSAGGGPYFDGISFHGYDYYEVDQGAGFYWNRDWITDWTTGTVMLAKAKFLKTTLATHGVTSKTLLFSEGALLCWLCFGSGGEDYEVAKAFYVPQLYAQSMADDIGVTLWYGMKDNQPTNSFGTGLLSFDLRPRYAYTAYQFTANQLSSATFVTQVQGGPLVKIYEFDRPSDTLWVAWAVTTTAQTITVPVAPSSVTNPFYPLPPPSTTLALDLNPSFIAWNKPPQNAGARKTP